MVLLMVSFTSSAKEPVTLRIAVAANFAYVIEQLLPVITPTATYDVDISVGSSGTLYAQILHGAPYDIFLSADSKRPQMLVRQGFADNAVTYAMGRLVIVTSDNRTLPLNILQQPQKRELLAIANPRLAPYGSAAKEVLQQINAWDKWRDKMVMGNNVLQTYQYVDSGNASIGLVAWSLALQAKKPYMLVPEAHHQPIKQQMVVLAQSAHRQQAERFSQALLSVKIQNKLPEYGYGKGAQ